MTANEKEMMRVVVREVERLHHENAVLRSILEDHVSPQRWERDYKRLMSSQKIAAHVRARLSGIYAEIESSPDLTKAFETLARGLPMPDERKMN